MRWVHKDMCEKENNRPLRYSILNAQFSTKGWKWNAYQTTAMQNSPTCKSVDNHQKTRSREGIIDWDFERGWEIGKNRLMLPTWKPCEAACTEDKRPMSCSSAPLPFTPQPLSTETREANATTLWKIIFSIARRHPPHMFVVAFMWNPEIENFSPLLGKKSNVNVDNERYAIHQRITGCDVTHDYTEPFNASFYCKCIGLWHMCVPFLHVWDQNDLGTTYLMTNAERIKLWGDC